MKVLRIMFQQMYHRKTKIGNEVVELDWVLLYTVCGRGLFNEFHNNMIISSYRWLDRLQHIS